ncbi:MAG: aminoacyltransferase, partial [Chloroflexota bacterium]|nr:aminoacyltransferase [Chloroflexota bacterium]
MQPAAISRIQSKHEWDAFVAHTENAHPFQSWGWGELKRRTGWKPVRVAVIKDDGRIAAGAQVLIRRRNGLSLAYIPRGPVVPPDRVDLYRLLL